MIDVSQDFNLNTQARKSCRPLYNEVCVGIVPVHADEMMVLFHACRGAETDRGIRSVTLARTMLDATTDVWHVARVDVTRHTGLTLTSRKGLSHVSVTAEV